MNDVEQKPWKHGRVERRSGFDRRRKKFPSFKELFKYRRRRHVRRKDDYQKIVILDKYSNAVSGVIIAILMLSLCDAFLTLFLTSIGAIESNPIMAFYLNLNEFTFVLVKYGLTALSVTIILTLPYASIRRLCIPVQHLLNCFAVVFSLVVAWEIFLIRTHFLARY